MFLLPEIAQQIVDEINTTISRDLNIMDHDGIIVASTDAARVGTLHTVARDLLKSGMDSYIVRTDDLPSGCRRGINLPITIKGERLGVVGITGDPAEVSGLGKVIQKMTEIMLIEVQQQAALSYLETTKHNFIERLLFGDVSDTRNLRITANGLDFDLFAPKTLALFGPIGDSLMLPSELAGQGAVGIVRMVQNLLKSSRSICVPINGNILVLFNENQLSAIRAQALSICQSISSFYNRSIYCGISQHAQDYTELPQKYKQALTACRVAASSGGSVVAVFNEQSLPFIIQSIPEYTMNTLMATTFARCDEAERTELLATLSLYFKHGGNTALAAEALFIHPNSFLYRLNKVKLKTGLDPRQPMDCSLLGLIVAYYNLQMSKN